MAELDGKLQDGLRRMQALNDQLDRLLQPSEEDIQMFQREVRLLLEEQTLIVEGKEKVRLLSLSALRLGGQRLGAPTP